MARDPVWTDPTASPNLFDAAAVSFDGISGGPDSAIAYPDPTRPGTFAFELTSMTALATVRPTAPTPLAQPSTATTAGAETAPASTATTPAPARAVTAPQPEPAWSRPGTYAAGQVATVGKVDIPDPVARRRGPLLAGRRNEPTVAYEPVAVYRSKPGTLAAPTLEQTRAQLAADRAGERRDSQPTSGRAGRGGRAVRLLSEDRAAQRVAPTGGRAGRRSGRRLELSAQSELAAQILGAVVIVAFLVLLIVGILSK